jgi:hypothetical protein
MKIIGLRNKQQTNVGEKIEQGRKMLEQNETKVSGGQWCWFSS